MGIVDLIAVSGLALFSSFVGTFRPQSLLGKIRGLLATLAIAGVATLGARLFAPASAWEKWFSALFLSAIALTIVRVGLLVVFEFFFRKRLGILLPRLTREVVSTVVYGLVLLLTLQLATGTDLKPFFATSAILSLVLGLALQETLGTLFAGLALIGERRLAVGTLVELDGVLGQIEELTWRAVILRTRLGQRVLLPNSAVTRATVRVWPPGSPVGLQVKLGTSYDSSPEMVRRVLSQVAESIPEVLAQPSPRFFLSSFGDSALVWDCRLWTSQPELKQEIVDCFLSRAWYALRREGIEIPFPQMVLHLGSRTSEIGIEEEKVQALQRCPVLAGLPRESLLALSSNSRVVVFGDGEWVLREGEKSRALFVVARGEACVVAEGQEIARLRPGELFGEVAFLTGQPRMASVMAFGELVAVEVDEEALRKALRQVPQLAEELAKRVATRTAELARLRELADATVPRNLKKTMLARLISFLKGGDELSSS